MSEENDKDFTTQTVHDAFRARDRARVEAFTLCAKAMLDHLQGETLDEADAMLDGRERVLLALNALMLPMSEPQPGPLDRLVDALGDGFRAMIPALAHNPELIAVFKRAAEAHSMPAEPEPEPARMPLADVSDDDLHVLTTQVSEQLRALLDEAKRREKPSSVG
jgi:hypothetical protein